MIHAVFFDFGGVVACLDRREMRAIELRHGLPEGGLWRAMYETPEWQALKIGNGSEGAWVGAIRRELDAMAGRPVAGAIAQEWVQCWRGLDENIVGLMQALRGRYRLGMISNATLTLEDELRDHHKIDHHFEVIVNSARVGMAKPDVRIYQHAASALGLAPEACVHIDDLPHNITGARQAGFHAVQYDGDFAALERELRALGVEW
jgi:putative hydrolase of the HAD superfamily